MRRASLACAALALTLTLSAAEEAPKQRGVLLRCGRLVDVKAGRYLADHGVLLSGEKITDVGPFATLQTRAPRGTLVLDLSRLTVLPGLIDVHAHLLSSMDARLKTGENILVAVTTLSAAKRALLGAANAREALMAGITTVRNVGHSGIDGDVALRDAIDEGWVTGPRILAAARKLTPPGGQALALRSEIAPAVVDLEFLAVSGPEEARKAVRQAVFDGADVIKVVVDAGPRILSADEMKAIVAEAHRSSRRVAAHATSRAAIQAAIEGGVDSIEHGEEATDEDLGAMKARGIVLVPTDWSAALLHELYAKARPYSKDELAQLDTAIQTFGEKSKARLLRAIKSGVVLAFGSDMWFRYPGRTRGQAALATLEGLQAEGLPPADILRAATVHAASLLGWSDRVGSIEAGRFADIVALEGDPLKDVKDLQNVSFVMKGGTVVRSPQ